jgi:chemotaxis signal transduction protein
MVGLAMDNLTEELVSERPQLQTFSRAGVKFAIPAEEIAAVVDWRRPTALPQAPPAVLGVVSIQGRMLTVLDPVVLLHLPGGETIHNGLIIALRGDEQLALVADEKGETVAGNLENEANGESGLGITLNAETIAILDVRNLFTVAMRGRERRQRRF